MENLKFRVWDKQTSQMFYPDLKDFGDWLSCKNLVYSLIEIQQFTGVLDSKNKEIYEGDILQLKNGARWTVEFKNGSFIAFGNPLSAYSDERGHLSGLKMEVVGNNLN